jgi:hypothetical protein
MVIIFSHPKARNYLLTHGLVYTIRKNLRKHVQCKDWMTDKRTGKKICTVWVDDPLELDTVDEHCLPEYFVRNSGFDSMTEWLKAMQRLNQGKMLKSGWLYRVVKMEWCSTCNAFYDPYWTGVEGHIQVDHKHKALDHSRVDPQGDDIA